MAIVTGAGAGIGRASALALARAGVAEVIVVDVDDDGGRETCALVEADTASHAVFEHVDVGELDELERLFATFEGRPGPDVVHNNAGLVGGEPVWPDTPPAHARRMIDVNLGGVVLGTRLAVAAMTGRGGAVVNTASVAALGPLPDDPVYAATKAAIVSFTQSCAPLALTHGVRVNAILPGIVDTPMLSKTGDGRPAEWLAPLLPTMTLLSPDQVAAAVVELAAGDDRAGETLVVANPGPVT